MGDKISSKVINNFWDWFSSNCQKFGNNFENSTLLDELDIWVKKLGNFSWEVGPGKCENNALVIFPNGDLDLLKETKEIISSAKECLGWEYYYAKPPKDWDLTFDYEISNGEIIKIDASKYKYFLLQYDDGMFEIIIEMNDLKISYEDKIAIGEIALDGILGEERRMQIIDIIDVVDEFGKSDKNKASMLNTLSDHLKLLQA